MRNPAKKPFQFPIKFYQAIELEDDSILRWEENGTHVIICNQARFQHEVLPKYFRHSRLASWQRQLNLYGFKTVYRGEGKSGKSIIFHPQFQRGAFEEVSLIRRFHLGKKCKDINEADSAKTSPSSSPKTSPKSSQSSVRPNVVSPASSNVNKSFDSVEDYPTFDELYSADGGIRNNLLLDMMSKYAEATTLLPLLNIAGTGSGSGSSGSVCCDHTNFTTITSAPAAASVDTHRRCHPPLELIEDDAGELNAWIVGNFAENDNQWRQN